MAETKYGENVTTISFIKPEDPLQGAQSAILSGGTTTPQLRGMNLTIMYGVYKEQGAMGFIPGRSHMHNFDEVMLFIGADTNDLSKLGGEIEVSLGKEEEKHLISEPTAILVPKGLPHLPAVIRRVYDPFLFMTVSLNPTLGFTREP